MFNKTMMTKKKVKYKNLYEIILYKIISYKIILYEIKNLKSIFGQCNVIQNKNIA